MPRVINAGTGVRRSDTFFVDPREIRVDWSRNGRTETFTPEAIGRLADDMRVNGQLQPIACRTMPGKFIEIVCGYNRLRAALAVVETHPDFRIETKVFDGMNERDAFLMNVRENMIRSEVSPIDNAHNIRKLLNHYGFAQQEVAELYKRSATWVSTTLDLLRLPESVKAAIVTGELSGEAGHVLAKLPESQAAEALEEARERIAAEDAVGASPDPAPTVSVNGGHPPKPKKPRSKAVKDLTPAEVQSRKTAKQARLSAATKQAAAAKGVRIGRGLAELRGVLKGRQDDLSRKILGFLTGDISEDDLIYALDTSESPIVV